ncbi:MAG: hypothetical protein RI906_2105 [Pseudomonadota bacterium]|jgi:signal transduction histidine kinase
MNATHPATAVVIAMSLFLVVGLPVLTWASLAGRMDRAARVWYAGLAAAACGVVIIAVLQRYSAMTASCMTLAVLMLVIAIRLEQGKPGLSWRQGVIGFMLYLSAEFVIEFSGYRLTLGVLLSSSTLAILELFLLLELHALSRVRRSRGLSIIALGAAVFLLYNLGRVLVVLNTGPAPQIFSYAPLANAAVLSVPLGTVLLTVGHLIYSIEKANAQQVVHREAAVRAEERAVAADEFAAQLQQLVAQRDAMIMLNSRFSAVSSLAMYNSAIVHEISQPLQGLASVFDLLSLRAKTDDPDYIESLSHARDLLDKMAATLTSLRQLIAAHEPASDLLDLHEVVSGIIPIMRSEALRRGITLEWSDASSETASLVLANRILLERIVFNLVSNSFEALSGDGKTPPPDMQNHASPSIRLEVLSDAQTGQAIIRVLDNGPGFDIASPGQLLQIYRTSKNQGVGLGLALARIILETWRGELRLRSESSADWKGAIVEVRLPLASAPSHQG